MNANVLAFNYRGVGSSSGWPYTDADLASDGVAATRYIMQTHRVKEHDILFHGHSIGGAVAVQAAATFNHINVVNDRSFAFVSIVRDLVSYQCDDDDGDADRCWLRWRCL